MEPSAFVNRMDYTLLVMKAAGSSEISVVIYQNVRRRNSEGIYGYNSLVFQNAKP